VARMLFLGLLLIGSGVVAGVLVGSRGGSTEFPVVRASKGESASAAVRQAVGSRAVKSGGNAPADALQRRLEWLSAQVAADAAERHRLQERVDALAAQLAALRSGLPGSASASSGEPNAVRDSPPSTGDAAPSQAADPAADGVSAVEHALVAAGIAPAAAAEIKHRQDSLALEEIYLRDQATREQWLDAPRFAEEMAKIQRQRTAMRDEIGDEAYDAYLAALGQPNRVRIEDVLHDSPAAQAGVQAGDIVLRYGDARIFATDELVAATHGGTPGENVHLELMRNGQPLAIDVPRGPLGVSIAGLVPPAPSGR
jgi:hypothetical protein